MKIQAWQIKTIKSAQTALGMDDAAYRALLAGYGVTSSTKLSAGQAKVLIEDLRAKAVASGVWQERGPGTGDRKTRKRADDPMAMKILALWLELHRLGKVRDSSDKALAGFVKRMTGKDALQWCSTADKTVVIEALKKMEARQDNGSVGAK